MSNKIKKIIAIVSVILCSQNIVLAFGGTYPEHPQYSNMSEQEKLSRNGFSPTDTNYIFEVDGKKFILLDTDDEGNYFVLTDDLYGRYAFDTSYNHTSYTVEKAVKSEDGQISYTEVDYSDFNVNDILFSTKDSTNIGYWLNNSFLTWGNDWVSLPRKVRNHLIEREWAVEGMNSAVMDWKAKEYDSARGESTGATIAKSIKIEP